VNVADTTTIVFNFYLTGQFLCYNSSLGWHLKSEFYTESKKGRHYILVHIFAKY